VGKDSNSGYADDTGACQSGDTLEEVEAALQVLADQFTAYTKGNGLALNASKTQLMVNKKAGNFSIVEDGAVIRPTDSLELLGVRFNDKFTTRRLYRQALVMAACTRASLVARLGHHLPCGQLLQQVAAGLVMGKISHALAAIAAPRLPGLSARASSNLAQIQVACNDVTRTVMGGRRSDHVHVKELLERAGLPSVNAMVVKSVGMEVWSSFHSNDGGAARTQSELWCLARWGLKSLL
jgi:hypothetical protein